jgi:hypothetical protein
MALAGALEIERASMGRLDYSAIAVRSLRRRRTQRSVGLLTNFSILRARPPFNYCVMRERRVDGHIGAPGHDPVEVVGDGRPELVPGTWRAPIKNP